MSRFFLCCLLFALPAAAQLDASKLRAKYGAPLHRETFHLPRGFDLIADYGPDNQVCKLEVPAEMPPPPNASSNPKQDMQNFLADLVPSWMRGKELNRAMWTVGGFSVSYVFYQHITILDSESAGRGELITIEFKNTDCR